jgi:hypothetical protein
LFIYVISPNEERKGMVWPKLTVSDYPEMLRKLSAAVFLVVVGCIWFLRIHVGAVDRVFRSFDLDHEVTIFGPLSIPFGTFIVAFVIAVISESIKLHDKISDLLRIRAVFDIRWILIPMALLSNTTIESKRFIRIMSDRQRLMREVFYKYASSSKDAEIDRHLVTQALTAWSWYWVCIESNVIVLPTAALLAWFGQWLASTVTLTIAFLGHLLMKLFRAEANKYAEAEVSQILADEDRREAVKSVFDAL